MPHQNFPHGALFPNNKNNENQIWVTMCRFVHDAFTKERNMKNAKTILCRRSEKTRIGRLASRKMIKFGQLDSGVGGFLQMITDPKVVAGATD